MFILDQIRHISIVLPKPLATKTNVPENHAIVSKLYGQINLSNKNTPVFLLDQIRHISIVPSQTRFIFWRYLHTKHYFW